MILHDCKAFFVGEALRMMILDENMFQFFFYVNFFFTFCERFISREFLLIVIYRYISLDLISLMYSFHANRSLLKFVWP